MNIEFVIFMDVFDFISNGWIYDCHGMIKINKNGANILELYKYKWNINEMLNQDYVDE